MLELGALSGLIATIVAVSIGLNLFMSGLQKILEVFKDRTVTEVDNRAHSILGKVIDALRVVIQWGSANRQPSAAPAPAIEEKKP